MRVVLYAEDMEAITVLDMPDVVASYLERYGRARIPVLKPFSMSTPQYTDRTIPMPRAVEITAECFLRNGVKHMMLFTRDDEAALLLRSELLPGQRRDAQEDARRHFARGFLGGLLAMTGD